jgi:hypothetical protein
MRKCLFLAVLALLSASSCVAQARGKASAPNAAPANSLASEISGMYTFVREGEFVQITVEEGSLTGFVSRYGQRESDKDAFLDQFFSKGSLEGDRISFTTKAVHGTWYEFAGAINHGEGKTPNAEGYWVIRGTLKQYDEDENKHVSAKSREITFKSFPQDVEGQPK